MAALTYGWRKVLANFGPIVVAVLGYILALIVVIAVLEIVVYGAVKPTGTFGRLLITGLVSGLIVVFFSVVQAGIARISLAMTDGRSFTTADVFTTDNLGNVIVTGILIGIAVAIGSILCYLPGLIVQFLVTFAIFFVVDKRLAPVEAITASIKLVVDNLGVMIVFFILSGVALLVGACLICIGLFVAIPVIIIGQAYLFRRLQGEPVSA